MKSYEVTARRHFTNGQSDTDYLPRTEASNAVELTACLMRKYRKAIGSGFSHITFDRLVTYRS